VNTTEAFRVALARYGPPLTAEHIHPDTAPGFEEFRRLFCSYMTRNGKVAPDRVHADWVENLSFNALVTSRFGVDCLGMFAGVPLRIYNYFYCFLSDPLVLPSIVTSTEESRDTKALDGLRRQQLSALSKAPRGQLRRDAAMHLAWNATMFVFFHELAHLEACHLRLLRESHGLNEFLELPVSPVSNDESHLRLLLEMDADQLAANNLSLVWRSKWDNGELDALAPLGLKLSWSISLSMLFMLMDNLLSFHAPLGNKTHPSPMARLIYIATLATNKNISGFEIDEGTTLQGLGEVQRWWIRENLGLSNNKHGLTMDIHDKLAALRLELSDKYCNRLTQYTQERRMTLGLDV